MKKIRQPNYEPKLKVNCSFEKLLKIAIKSKPVVKKEKPKPK